MSDQPQQWSGPVSEADVYKAGRLAGRLSKTSDGVQFSYLDDYLSNSSQEHDPVATTLPLSDKPVLSPSGAVPPFFSGLLPEGRRLSSLRRRIKASLDDELSLLVAVGLDTVGDVQVVRAGENPSQLDSSRPELFAPEEISFAELLSDEIPLDGVGLAGVQDKVSGKNIVAPVKHRGKDTILKLSPPEYPHLVENEAYFLTLAKRAGIACVEHSVIHDRDGVSGLLISRFDRVPSKEGNPSAKRLPVEDGCQVLGLWPGDKYSPTTKSLIQTLTEHCTANIHAASLAFEQVVFAVVTGNGDLHAKNMSIVKREGEWELAPAYDLPSTLFYGDNSMALPIAGKVRDFSHRQLLEFASSLGLSAKVAQRTINNLLEATVDLESDLKEGALAFDSYRLAETVSALRYRRRLLSADN